MIRGINMDNVKNYKLEVKVRGDGFVLGNTNTFTDIDKLSEEIQTYLLIDNMPCPLQDIKKKVLKSGGFDFNIGKKVNLHCERV